MIRELAVCGLIAIAFGAAAAYGGGELSWFSWLNLVGGGLALAAAIGTALFGLRGAGAPAFRGTLVRGGLRIVLALVAAIGLERAAAGSGVQFDWTFERRFELSDATTHALEQMCGELDADLYFDAFDPRIRSTRQLLRTLEKTGCLAFRERRIADHPDAEDRYGIASSNTVVLRRRGPGRERWERVDRPSEGTVYEALFRLRDRQDKRVLVPRGAGEGDLEQTTATGYSGLGAALDTEGYEVHQFVSAATDEIPEGADLVVWIAPERRLRAEALDALRAYLEDGGRLVALVEPGRPSGLEEVLGEWGLTPLPGVVVDPASGPVAGDAPGVNPLVYSYARSHPVAEGLGAGRMTFFRGACGFDLLKPRIEDRLNGIAFTSPTAWRSEDLGVLERRLAPEKPDGAREDFYPLVAAGEYERDGKTTRIVAFCDGELASNRNLRTLFNLDLVMNAVHWAAENEPEITLRPKIVGVSGGEQFPIPVQNTLTMFQSLGLVIPELLLLVGALFWLRQRTS